MHSKSRNDYLEIRDLIWTCTYTSMFYLLQVIRHWLGARFSTYCKWDAHAKIYIVYVTWTVGFSHAHLILTTSRIGGLYVRVISKHVSKYHSMIHCVSLAHCSTCHPNIMSSIHLLLILIKYSSIFREKMEMSQFRTV